MHYVDIYQLKIKYDHHTQEKYGIVFIDSNEAASLNREKILDKVRPITSRLNYRSQQELKIQYLDDEKNFVDLSSDKYCISELLSCAVQLENANFKRNTLRIEESCSPLQPALPRSQQSTLTGKQFCQQTQLSPSSMPSIPKEQKTSSFSRRSLNFPSSMVTIAITADPRPNAVFSLQRTSKSSFDPGRSTKWERSSVKGTTTIFASPIEKFLERQKERLSRLEEDERKLATRTLMVIMYYRSW